MSSVIIHQIEAPANARANEADRVMRPLVLLIDETLLAAALAGNSTAANTITRDILAAVRAEKAATWADPRRR